MSKGNSLLVGFCLILLIFVGVFYRNQQAANENSLKEIQKSNAALLKKNDDLLKQIQTQTAASKPKSEPPKIVVNGHTFYRESNPNLVMIQAFLALHDPRVNEVLKKFNIQINDLNGKHQFP